MNGDPPFGPFFWGAVCAIIPVGLTLFFQLDIWIYGVVNALIYLIGSFVSARYFYVRRR